MATGFPDFQSRAFTSADNLEQQKISATDLESTNSFSQEIKSVLIHNSGASSVHLNFDAIATSNHLKIPVNSWFSVDLRFTDIHAICATNETATLYCIGTY